MKGFSGAKHICLCAAPVVSLFRDIALLEEDGPRVTEIFGGRREVFWNYANISGTSSHNYSHANGYTTGIMIMISTFCAREDFSLATDSWSQSERKRTWFWFPFILRWTNAHNQSHSFMTFNFTEINNWDMRKLNSNKRQVHIIHG